MVKIITQAYLEKQLKNLTHKEIKVITGRERLGFSYKKIAFYCYQIFRHQTNSLTFVKLHKELRNKKVKYSTYSHHIHTFSPLVKWLFKQINKELGVTVGKHYNVVDTTLIEEKDSRYINEKDWASKRVTTRAKNNKKTYTCGSKGLFFINDKKEITHTQLFLINSSDDNFLKDCIKSLSILNLNLI